MINKYAGIEYEDVVRQYADDITRLCVVWTQNEEAAKDCFQNTFLKLYLTEQTFREEEHIKAWLYTVARNECRDYHRQFWNRKVDIGYVPQENQKAGSLQIEDEETEQLVVALRKLPFRYREVIVLYYYEEYGTGEIAKMLHTSVNTVKSRLRRGREKLAAIMKN